MKYLNSKIARIKTYFITFVISRFVPDYEKIKAENKELKQDIYNLIVKENEIDGIKTKIQWKIVFDIDDMILSGDATKNDDQFQLMKGNIVKFKDGF